jgi:hypothetical protein
MRALSSSRANGFVRLGLVVLVLLVVWLAFQALRGPETSGQFPTAPTATAYAVAFQATVAAAETAQPSATRQPTPQTAAQPTAVAPTRATTAVAPSTAAPAVTSQVATTVPAPVPTLGPTQAPSGAGPAEPVRTATVSSVGADRPSTATVVPTVPPDVEQEIADAYLNKYWQAKADAFYLLDPAPLEAVAAGPELDRLRQRIEDDKAQGRATLVKTQHTFAVSWARDGEAEVVDRYADMSIWVDATTKEPLPGQVEPPIDSAPIHKVVDKLQFIDGTWKVTDGVEIVEAQAAP